MTKQGRIRIAGLLLATLFATATLFAHGQDEHVFRYNFHTDQAGPRLDIGKTFTILGPNLFASLTRISPSNEIIGGAASRWDVSEDGLTYTFHLHEDMTWSDGQPLTAHDYVYGWLRALDPETRSLRAWMLYVIEGAEAYNAGEGPRDAVAIQAPDDHTLEVSLAQPAAFFPAYVAANNVYFAQPRHVIEEHGDEWIRLENLVYSGPFMLTRHVPNSVIEMEPNPGWTLDRGNITKIEQFIIGDGSTALAMFEAGDLDLAMNLPIGELGFIRSQPELQDQFMLLPSAQVLYFGMNTSQEPWDDVLVRRAFIAAIDVAPLMAGPFQGIFEAAYSLRPAFLPGGDFDYMRDAFDPERARQLLAEAGYPDGEGFPDVAIQVTSLANNVTTAEYLQLVFSQVLNVDVNVEVLESQGWSELVQTGRGDSWLANAFSLSPDLYDLYSVVWQHAGVNSHFSDPRFDALLEQAAEEGDPAARLELYNEAERYLVLEHAVMVPLWFPDRTTLIGDRAPGLLNEGRSIWSHSWEFLNLE